MFSFWEARQQRRKAILRTAIIEGQATALEHVIGSMISLMPAAERQVLIEVIKAQLGNGFRSEAPWLDKEAKQLYDDSVSLTLQLFIPKQDHAG